MNLGNFGVGLGISFGYAWAITLLILAFVPFMIISGAVQVKLMTGFSGKDKDNIEETGKLTNEAISNIRTVTSLNKQRHFTEKYTAKINEPLKFDLCLIKVYSKKN
jgi:ABC-type bacteriocin/lantibiotic exporter with double-glycine peptidase domain